MELYFVFVRLVYKNEKKSKKGRKKSLDFFVREILGFYKVSV